MTNQITLSNWERTISVDITNYHPQFTFTTNNPFIQYDPPQPPAGSATASENFNSVVVNLAMFAPKISLTFTELTGIGDNPFDWSSVDQNSKNFVKLSYLSQIDKNLKCLYINDNNNCLYCQIASYRGTCVAGEKDIVRHALDLVLISKVNEP
jgi:hypothetical protein